MQYVSIFATYVCDDEYCETMLAPPSLIQQYDLSALQHIKFIRDTLDVYKKQLQMWFASSETIVALINSVRF